MVSDIKLATLFLHFDILDVANDIHLQRYIRIFSHNLLSLSILKQFWKSSIDLFELFLNFKNLWLKAYKINILSDMTNCHLEGWYEEGQGWNQTILFINHWKHNSLLNLWKIFNPLDIFMKIQTVRQEFHHRLYKSKFQYGIFFDIWQIRHNRVVRLN